VAGGREITVQRKGAKAQRFAVVDILYSWRIPDIRHPAPDIRHLASDILNPES
jgi:hypothetical protein